MFLDKSAGRGETGPFCISIIIATQDRPVLLLQCFEALRPQVGLYGDKVEVLLYNDGGLEDTSLKEYLKKYPCAVKYFRGGSQRGPAYARNVCLKAARFDLVAFLDDDAVPLPDWLVELEKVWREFPGYDGVGGHVMVDPREPIESSVSAFLTNWFAQASFQTNLSQGNFATCNASYKKKTLENVGAFNERFALYGEDRDLNLRLSKSGALLRLDPRFRVYHQRDLTLKSLLRKYFYYGTATYQFYSMHHETAFLSKKAYLKLFDFCKEFHSIASKMHAACLIVCTQVLLVCGYAYARLGGKRASPGL